MNLQKTPLAVAVMAALPLALTLTGCVGGSEAGGANNVSVNAGPDRVVESGSVIFIEGDAYNKGAYLDYMRWTVRDGNLDSRSTVEIRDGGRCDFDPEVLEDRDYSIEDRKTCAVAVEIGPVAQDVEFTMQLAAYETGGLSNTDRMQVAVRSSVQDLSVNAGPDQAVMAGDTVERSCSYQGGFFHDRENPEPRYQWELVNDDEIRDLGAHVDYRYDELSGMLELATPETLPDGTPIVMRCIVTDEAGQTDSADTEILVQQEPPIEVTAIPEVTAAPGDLVDLQGSVESPEGGHDSLFYRWVQLSGTETEIFSSNMRNASISVPVEIDQPEEMVFEFQASNEPISDDTVLAESARARTIVNVETGGMPALTANAGAVQNAVSGEVVNLEGSVEDPASTGGPYYYQWSQLAGPSVNLSGSNTSNPSFIAPTVTEEEELVFELRVSRDPIDSSTAFAGSEISTTMVRVVEP
ncbi:hypothetical protein [Thioalkalivibrio sp. ALE16]|uniref:PKD domain-containing protein n=1 Tax=Thioalkalivibrio sp. ALE16 TaxID=1158172 RepID=UPI000363E680|nr:hypothetical protein [Thioalkalivibrio sp. ALE16]